MRVHLRSLLLLLALDLLFFHALLLKPDGILYSPHSDLIAEHIPAKRFLVRSFQQTGELPLWCPHLFAGSPFVHDIQVAIFYPPHLVLLLLPEEAAGPALSWLVVLHVLLAGWLMYAYASQRGLPPVPALVAGIGFMFGGRWLMHLLGGGHYIVIGLAWLPLVLLAWERAIAGKGSLWGLLASAAFALLTLGTQPQWTFYSGLFAGLWTLGAALEQKRLLRWVSCGLSIVVLTIGLTAIQLLPTLEAAGQSSRAGGVSAEGILDGGVRVLLFLVGPSLTTEPFNGAWEDRGGLGVLWLIVAVWAPLLRKGRTRYEAAVCLGLFLFAMGGAILFQFLPGFNLFRQPARMAVIATLPLSWLGAVTVNAILSPDGLTNEQIKVCRLWLIRIAVGVVILVGGFALRSWLQGAALHPSLYYVAGPFLLVAAWGGLKDRSAVVPRRTEAVRWLILLAVDLLLLNFSLPAVENADVSNSTPASVRFVVEHREMGSRVLDVDQVTKGKLAGTPLGSGSPLALIHGVDSVRGYSPLDVRRYREFLQLIADEDRPLGALDSTFTYPVIASFPLKNRTLLDLLGVRFLLLPASEKPPGEHWHAVGRDDISEAVYDFLAGGMIDLEEYVVWENEDVLPRAFVVPEAKALPERASLLETFKKTDFREVVYLEDFDEELHPRPPFSKRPEVTVLSHEPNRVRLESDGRESGFLVLSDVWYPGWKCTIDGAATPIYRANTTFRAVKLPAGVHRIEFRFEPASYSRGRVITFASLGLLVFLALIGGLIQARRGTKAVE